MRIRLAALLACPAALLLSSVLTGCGGSSSGSNTVTTTPPTGGTITGTVLSVQQPVVGAHVYLFAANTTAYGAASTSLLVASATGASDSVGAYVLSGSTGSFTLTADFNCIANTQVYLYALGGNTGTATNSAAGFLAALPSCPSTGSSISAVTLNAVSTVATAYATAGYAVDATHVSSSGTSLAVTGIANAFANAANLETLSTGAALATTPAGNGTVPQKTINSIANILTSCIASTGPTSASCTTLFAGAKSAGSTGTAATDTATAAINIAHNPGQNVTALYALATPSPAFSPVLSAAPNDYTIGINYSGVGTTGAGLNQPYSVAIDPLGDAWFTDLDGGNFVGNISRLSNLGAPVSPSTGYVPGTQIFPNSIAIDLSSNAWVVDGAAFLTKYSATGTLLSPAGGYTGGGLGAPQALAIDGSGNLWIANFSNASISKFNSSGVAQSGSSGYTGGGLNQSQGIAIDSSNNVWVANHSPGSGSISKFTNAGVPISTSAGYIAGGINNPDALAIDASNNVWIANYGGNSVSELNSSGTAVSTTAYTGGGLNQPDAIAVDGGGNVWVANAGGNSVTQLTSAGVALSPTRGYTGGTLAYPAGIAVDASGNLWIANYGSSTTLPVAAVTELIGAAVPVVTPLSQAIGTSKLGTRP